MSALLDEDISMLVQILQKIDERHFCCFKIESKSDDTVEHFSKLARSDSKLTDAGLVKLYPSLIRFHLNGLFLISI